MGSRRYAHWHHGMSHDRRVAAALGYRASVQGLLMSHSATMLLCRLTGPTDSETVGTRHALSPDLDKACRPASVQVVKRRSSPHMGMESFERAARAWGGSSQRKLHGCVPGSSPKCTSVVNYETAMIISCNSSSGRCWSRPRPRGAGLLGPAAPVRQGGCIHSSTVFAHLLYSLINCIPSLIRGHRQLALHRSVAVRWAVPGQCQSSPAVPVPPVRQGRHAIEVPTPCRRSAAEGPDSTAARHGEPRRAGLLGPA
jgi:hypothetical protein